MKNGEECGRQQSWPDLKKYPNICLGELSKHTRHRSTVGVSAMTRKGNLQDKLKYFAAKELSTM